MRRRALSLTRAALELAGGAVFSLALMTGLLLMRCSCAERERDP